MTSLSAWLVHFWDRHDRRLSDLDWQITRQQRLLGVVAGAVYADDGGVLDRVRRRLAWYPDVIWRWLLACQWHRLAQEEAFVARTVTDLERVHARGKRAGADARSWPSTASGGCSERGGSLL